MPRKGGARLTDGARRYGSAQLLSVHVEVVVDAAVALLQLEVQEGELEAAHGVRGPADVVPALLVGRVRLREARAPQLKLLLRVALLAWTHCAAGSGGHVVN